MYLLPLADGTELVFEQSYIDVRTMGHSVYDPDWRFTDAAGHDHYRQDSEFPTLEERWDAGEADYESACTDSGCSCWDDPEPVFAGYYCKTCGETIEPGRKWKGEERLRIPGVRGLYRRGTLRGISTEEARELYEKGIAETLRLAKGGGTEAEIYQYLGEADALAVLDEIGVHPRVLKKSPGVADMFRELIGLG